MPAQQFAKQNELYKDSQTLIDQGRYDDALRLLRDLDRGDLSEIMVLVNRTTCEYATSRISEGQKSLTRLLQALEQAPVECSFEIIARATIESAKFLELEGEIATAMDLLNRLREQAEGNDLNARPRLFLYANLLRLASLYGTKESLHDLYAFSSRLIKLAPKDVDTFEGEHALMLTEAEIIGYRAVATRFTSILERKNISKYDQALIFFDLLEVLISKGEIERAKEFINTLHVEPQVAFEKVLREAILAGSDRGLKTFDLTYNELSTSDQLRGLGCLFHLANSEANAEIANLCRIRFELLLSALKDSSRRIWKERFFDDRGLKVHYCPHDRRVTFNAKSVELRSGHPVHVFFSLLIKNPALGNALDPEFLVREIWDLPFDENSYQRLRMSLSRFNAEFAAATGLERLISLTKNQAILRADVKIIPFRGD